MRKGFADAKIAYDKKMAKRAASLAAGQVPVPEQDEGEEELASEEDNWRSPEERATDT